MNNNREEPWIKVKLKTLDDVRLSWPLAWCWKNIYLHNLFPPADEVVIPFLGKVVWVRELSTDPYELLYEIRDSRGLIVIPEWIDHFIPSDSVFPSGWQDPSRAETWMGRFEDRFIVFDDIVIIHG